MAVVVRREPASSAQVGNTALITEAGDFHGWLGGSCIQPTVVREAMAALGDGSAAADLALARSRARPPAGRHGVPDDLPQRRQRGHLSRAGAARAALLVFGVSPAAQALARLGKVMGYTVDVVDPDADRASFPDADRLIATTAGERNRPPSQTRAALRGRGHARPARRGGDSGGARPRARLSRRRRQPQALRPDARDARGARRDAAGTRLDREPGRHRHRRPRAGGSRAQHPGGDRPGAARGRAAAGASPARRRTALETSAIRSAA